MSTMAKRPIKFVKYGAGTVGREYMSSRPEPDGHARLDTVRPVSEYHMLVK